MAWAICQSSIVSVEVRCGSRCRLRYRLMYVLVRMRYRPGLQISAGLVLVEGGIGLRISLLHQILGI